MTDPNKDLEILENDYVDAILTVTGKKRNNSDTTMYQPKFTWENLPPGVMVYGKKPDAQINEIHSGDELESATTTFILFKAPANLDADPDKYHTITFTCNRTDNGSNAITKSATLRFVNNYGLWDVVVNWNE